MKYSLGDFLLGVVHTFVIFAPGALLLVAFLYAMHVHPVTDPLPFRIDETAGWLLALIASFVLGHLNSLLASRWEDRWEPDEAYRRKEASPALRATAERALREHAPHLYGLTSTRAAAAKLLRQRESEAFVEIERKDADRRFFRNVLFVFLFSMLLMAWAALEGAARDRWLAGGCAALALLSYLRYRDQDQKYTKLAFESLVLALPPEGPPPVYSWELRWFVKDGAAPPAPFTDWIRRLPGTGIETRTDEYAPTASATLGAKWREGRFETKRRLDREVVDRRQSAWWGALSAELWEKQLAPERDAPPPHAVPVVKHRRVWKVTPRSGGTRSPSGNPKDDVAAHPGERRAVTGCQVEIARVELAGETWWTLGLETFGPLGHQKARLSETLGWLDAKLSGLADFTTTAEEKSYPALLATPPSSASGSRPAATHGAETSRS